MTLSTKNEETGSFYILPRQLGRYVLLSRLHGGGMTEVYAARLAEEVGPGRLLVIKILPKSRKDDPEAEARFLEEARIILNMTHGNITAAFEFGREDGRPFLVMEYVPGPSLRRLLDSRQNTRRQLNLQDSLFISREVCRALSYAHSFSDHAGSGKGIIHRDISPGNILISTAGQVKLSDFGIAEFVHGGFFGPLWGKAAYVAPEVASGGAPSPASDLYSLGTVLYECLTGAPPIIGNNDKETLKLVSTDQPKPPSIIRTELSTELDIHLLRLLKKDPQQRPSSASELEVELTTMLGNAGPSYTEPDLAKTVQQYFSAEDFSVQTPKENLRSSILQAGVALHGGETTEDLLATKTVPLDGQTKTAHKKFIDLTVKTEQKKGRSRNWLRVGLLLILFIVTAVFALNQIEQTEKQRTSIGNRVKAHSSRSSTASLKTDGQKPAQEKAPRTKERIGENNQVPEAAEWGWLNINSYPWSYVSVDGKKLSGHTPYSKIKLPTGTHVLIFENPQLGLKTTKKVTIKAWEESNIGVRLE
ncbi:MAG: serine/threonine protein kinase [Proteobacteria bacterium]|nr:serine/threonine protein kinase [Pseudomonadota bacterium]